MSKSVIVISAILLCLVVGCGREQSPMGPGSPALRHENTGNTQAQLSATEVLSVQLNLFVGFANGQPVNVHRITADWEPATVTWNSFGGAYNANVEGSFATVTSGWQSIDITGLVQDWVDDTQPNFGLLLDQAVSGFSPQIISSMETGSLAPFLVICYDPGGDVVCDTLTAQADVFVDQMLPDNPTEGNTVLQVAQMMTPSAEKQALIRFGLPDFVNQQLPASIGGQVWDDVNQDGVHGQDEPGLSGVVVNLYDCLDSFVLATTTDIGGAYLFADLPAGSYLVEFVAGEGYLFSPPGQTADDSLDSDADPATGLTVCLTVAEGEDASFWSAGMYLPPDPDDPDDPGCTRGKGYWKNHAGFGPQLDELSDLLPLSLGSDGGDMSLFVADAQTAADVLAMKTYGSPKNGITKLYAHLLTAKLNIASGADAEKVAGVIDEADAFLADRSWVDWKELDRDSRNLVLEWKDVLESYNNGEIGPGSCD
ncbi:MAG: DNRLRE domain-containing protein [candidate division Zixibacteria bacterium]|nr:DNRLRE domain-containing protein [candidate division Zixibacteria bacterium]MDH3937233.1 DNRLRE domain-containing protein [candidate division Zixibacteria bacterium]MDH4035080.1 DNRLRE domain-containing protein [candidate division Zixibacteria bacterium]